MKTKRLSIILIASLLLMPSFAMATSDESESNESSPSQLDGEGSFSEKHEVVYATLNAFGQQDEMYVVNQFDVIEHGEMIDYGPYETVQNLTNLEDIELNDEEVTFRSGEDQFYYQGNLNGKPLPWTFDIRYTLDGEEVNPHDILGEDGHLQIEIETSGDDEVNPVFYENYLMQISLALDSEIYNQIEAEDGTVASAGKNKQVTFTVMPEEDETFVVEANVSNFEFDGVEISALPPNMSFDEFDTDEMQDEMNTLAEAFSDLHDGVGDLRDGVFELNDGVSDLHDGSSDYLSGMNELDEGSADLIEGSQEIQNALNQMRAGFETDGEIDLSDLDELEQALRQIADGLYEAEEGIAEIRENYDGSLESLREAINDIPVGELSEDNFDELYDSDIDPEVIDELVQTYEAAQNARENFDESSELFNYVVPVLEELEQTVNEIAVNLEQTADEFAEGLDELDFIEELEQLETGLEQLANQYGEFHAGLVEYTGGVGELSSNYSGIHEGIGELSDGTAVLGDGVDELHDGTGELAQETSDLPAQMQSEIDELMDDFDFSDFEPVSFMSERNENVETVQFVIQTESITIDDDEDDDEVEEEEKGIWERFLDLFR
ncbi:YhgE/Pip domain-containing protein [Alkalibacillus haloalkaliphilus]|uniref:X-X-X-Leu-X-X-Gly heptad repeat-containing protein n=1 Tax=Alkalibacillus haloalkaliphilus TaxID=94136 RepID=A0A511W2Z6_9BACI|nr:YhgE/Pip domain-containing protein [Alkalibacillus haloalkaliphilus]GEN45455.1 hypothetical protein AHA02nite_12310 [Alkalibacillus haloalkaliphilus]